MNNILQLATRLEMAKKVPAAMVRTQRLNFSVDSKKLVAALQVSQTPQRHAIYINVWECSGASVREEASLDPIPLTVVRFSPAPSFWAYLTLLQGYADDSGLSTVFYITCPVPHPPRIFLATGSFKSYPSLLFPCRNHRHKHLDLDDHRIENAAQCATPGSEHKVLLRSGRHKLFLLDARTGVVRLLADLEKERKRLGMREEGLGLGLDGENMRVLWRWEGGLRCSRMGGEVVEIGALCAALSK